MKLDKLKKQQVFNTLTTIYQKGICLDETAVASLRTNKLITDGEGCLALTDAGHELRWQLANAK